MKQELLGHFSHIQALHCLSIRPNCFPNNNVLSFCRGMAKASCEVSADSGDTMANS